jgi:hypothetical protein
MQGTQRIGKDQRSVHKILIAVDRHLGAEVGMKFDERLTPHYQQMPAD